MHFSSYLLGLAIALFSPSSLFFASPGSAYPIAQAQTQEDQQAEADRLLRQGIEQFNRGQTQEALSTFQRELALRQRLGDRANEGRSYGWIGLVYSRLGRSEEAITAQRQALSLAREVGYRAGEGATLNNLGAVYNALGQYPQALDYYSQALVISKEVGDRAGEGDTLNNLGAVYNALGQYPQALDYYSQALVISKEVGDRAGEGVTLTNLGAVYNDLGQYPEALDYYSQALVISKEVGDRAGEGTTLNNLGLVYNALGQYPEALDYYSQALAISKEVGDRAGEGVTLNNLGSVYWNLGQYPQALDYYSQALAIRKEVGDRAGEGQTLNNLGLVYNALGQYPQALDYYSQALAIRKEVGDRAGEGTTLTNLGAVYNALGQYPQALDYFTQALAIYKEVGDRAGEGTTLNNLGTVYNALGQYPQALDYFTQALAIRKEVGDRAGEGMTLNNLGAVYHDLGQYPQALDYYSQALAIRKEVGDRAGEGMTLNNLGAVYNDLGQYPQAIDYFTQALAIRKEVGDRAGEAITLGNIGFLLANQDQAQPQLAIVFYKQSINITEAIRQELGGLPKDTQDAYTQTVARTYRELADLLLQQDRVLEAQQVLDLLKVQELDEYLRGVRGTGQTLPILQPEQEILNRYNTLQATAIQLGQERATLQKRLRQGETLSLSEQQRLDQLLDLQRDLSEQFKQFAASPTIVALLEQLTPRVLRQTVSLDKLDSLRENLANLHAVLLYPLILDDRLELVITTGDSPPLRRPVPVTQAQLNAAILQFRQALNDPNSDPRPSAQQLYQWLIAPIEADLQQAGAQTILYAPDAQLRYIPLSALYDGKQWLVQRYGINNITADSLTDFQRQPAVAPRVLIGAFADPDLRYSVPVGQTTEEFAGLPFAGAEATAIAALLGNTTSFVDVNFNQRNTQRYLNASNIVHFATHAALVPGIPEDSFILFGDGTRANVSDIGLWSMQNVDLVVLSACQTGLADNLGNGEEILGLGYQFEQRGARAVVASLWQVSDGGTQSLMDAFYAALESGNSKTEALRQAQMALITGNYTVTDDPGRGIVGWQLDANATQPSATAYSLNHPYYWAPFILIGNGL